MLFKNAIDANEEDEAVAEDLADYYKGEAFIIMEEFTLSLLALPHIYDYLFKLVDVIMRLLFTGVTKISTLT